MIFSIIDIERADDDLLLTGLDGCGAQDGSAQQPLTDSELLEGLDWGALSAAEEGKSTMGPSDLLGDFLPSHLLQLDQLREEVDGTPPTVAEEGRTGVAPGHQPTAPAAAASQSSAVSWLSLFADLDPLANTNSSI